MITFGLLAHNEIKKFQDFIRDNWSENHIFAKETTVFDWQYKEEDAYNCIVAREGEELLGIELFIPLSHFDKNLDKQIFSSLWIALDKEPGIGLRLFERMVRAYEFTASVGVASSVIPYHCRQGFMTGTMNHHVALSPYVKEFKIAQVPQGLIKRRLG